MGLRKQTARLFKHRASGDQLKERKAARKLEHPTETVEEIKTVAPFLRISQENKALRVAGGKDLRVDTRKVSKRLSKGGRTDDGN